MSEPKGLVPSAVGRQGGVDALVLPLFVFGTLLDQPFMANLLGRPVCSKPARLSDFRVEPLTTFDFPVLVPAAGETVDGELYRDLGADDFVRVDAYHGVEEGLYVRVAVNVTAADRSVQEAACAYLPTERTMSRGRL
jgi:gamma-glutamylcyclotransferase (GGCT)/AIG2-like uncharacterized protein YtfP